MPKQTRWCSIGDTISTTRKNVFGANAGNHLHVLICNNQSCAEANDLIESGRWAVSACGRCNNKIENCLCESTDKFKA